MTSTPPSGLTTEYPITVLLIDDQLIVGEALRRMLAEEKDIRFHYCADPTKALDMAKQVSPTVILQDLVMPQMDGLVLVKAFRANTDTAQIPLIVLSSKEEPKTKADAFAFGANDYMVKLPDRLEVLARIRYHSKGYINLLQRNTAYNALEASQKLLAEDLAHAAEYVESLLPQPLKDTVTASTIYVPSMQLGGDACGYHWQDDRHLAIYLLDVCGHGVGAALLSVSVLNILRAHALPGVDFKQPEQVLAALNEAFQMEKHNDMYFTLWYGVYDKETRALVCASGGHPPAILINGKDITQLMPPGAIVGGWAEAKYKAMTVSVPQGSKLYVFSDGIFEIEKPDGKFWSLEEFIDLLSEKAAQNKDNKWLTERLRELRGKEMFDDDISFMELLF